MDHSLILFLALFLLQASVGGAEKNKIGLLCAPMRHHRECSSFLDSFLVQDGGSIDPLPNTEWGRIRKRNYDSGGGFYSVVLSIYLRQIFHTKLSLEHPSSTIPWGCRPHPWHLICWLPFSYGRCYPCSPCKVLSQQLLHLLSYSSWKMVALSSKRCYSLNANNYLWPLCCLFLKDINEENFSCSNQSLKFRSMDNLEMQGLFQWFMQGYYLTSFAYCHSVLVGFFVCF